MAYMQLCYTQVLEGATAVALSCLICHLGTQGAGMLGLPGAVIPVVTGQPDVW